MSSLTVPVVFNPTAGGGRLLRQRPALDQVAAAAGRRLEWLETRAPGHAGELARGAAAAGHRLVLAFGGDGTYNEVAHGLLGGDAALGVLPGGTTSVLAYELGVPRPADLALAELLAGRDRELRVGRTSHGRLFLLMLSAGPDAMVLEAVRPAVKSLGGKLGVAAQAVRELVRRRPLPRFEVRWEGRAVPSGWAIVGKARCYGGPFPGAPDADPFAPDFDLVVMGGGGRWPAVRFALGIPSGGHVRLSGVIRGRVSRVALAPTPDGAPVPYQVDGDLAGHLPVEAWVEPRPLLVRLPYSRSAKSSVEM